MEHIRNPKGEENWTQTKQGLEMYWRCGRHWILTQNTREYHFHLKHHRHRSGTYEPNHPGRHHSSFVSSNTECSGKGTRRSRSSGSLRAGRVNIPQPISVWFHNSGEAQAQAQASLCYYGGPIMTVCPSQRPGHQGVVAANSTPGGRAPLRLHCASYL